MKTQKKISIYFNFINIKILIFIILAAIMSNVLASCSKEKQNENEILINKTQEMTLKITQIQEIKTFDPGFAMDNSSIMLAIQIFEGLLVYEPETLKVIHGVAHDYKNQDNQIFTFYLRKNAFWNDGYPVTANDFIYAWKRVLTPLPQKINIHVFKRLLSKIKDEEKKAILKDTYSLNEKDKTYQLIKNYDKKTVNVVNRLLESLEYVDITPYSYVMYSIKNAKKYHQGEINDFNKVGIKLIDKYTIKITLDSPTSYFKELMCFNTFMPIPKHKIEKYYNKEIMKKNCKKDPLLRDLSSIKGLFSYNGPFIKLDNIEKNKKKSKIKPNSSVVKTVCIKNPKYWDNSVVRLDRIEIIYEEDEETIFQSYEKGETDIVSNVPSDIQKKLLKENRPDIHVTPQLSTYYFVFNTTKPIFKNPKVRKALSYAVDRETICNIILGGGEIPAYCMTPNVFKGYFLPEKTHKYDPELAKQLLEEAGYNKNKKFPTIELIYNRGKNHELITKFIQQNWRNIGVECKMVRKEFQEMIKVKKNKKYEIARAGWIGDYQDPITFLDLFTKDAGMNEAGYYNKKFDELIEKSRRIKSNIERFEVLRQAESILLDDAPIIPIYFYTISTLVNQKVKNFFPNIRSINIYKNVYIEES